jgi:hypothetical protein
MIQCATSVRICKQTVIFAQQTVVFAKRTKLDTYQMMLCATNGVIL